MNRIISGELYQKIMVKLGEHGSATHQQDELRNAPSLQPPRGQVGEAIELAIRILNQESSMNGCIKGTIWADDHTTLVELLENTLEALRQPVDTVDNWDWKSVAIRLGEDIGRTGPDGYYSFTPDQWLDWIRKEYEALRTQPQAPVVEVSIEDCVRIATELQKISETIGESLHPEKFKSEAEMMAFYEQVKGKEIEAHAEAIHALLQSKGGRG